MPSSNQSKKAVIVDEISSLVKDSKGFVLTDYRGMSVAQSQDFKKRLKESGATLMVTKNTLLKRALDSAHISVDEVIQKAFEGPTATLFVKNDEIAPLKIWSAFFKTAQLPQLKLGYFWGRFLNASELIEMSKLPTKEVLYGKVVSGLSSPLYRLVRTLSNPYQKFVYTLGQVRDQKSN